MKTLLALLLTLALAGTAWADTVVIHFSYDNQGVPEYEASAFRTYIDGAVLCLTEEATVDPDGTLRHSCILDVGIIPGPHDFSMTAVYADNTESPMSNVVQAEIPEPPVVVPDPLGPQIIQIQIIVE